MSDLIEITETFGRHRKGQKIDITGKSPTEIASIVSELKKGGYNIININEETEAPHEHGDVDDNQKYKASESIDMANVHGAAGLIIDKDKPVKIKLNDMVVTKYTYENEDTGREFYRYEINIEYDGRDTTVRLPATVVENMYRQMKAANAQPTETYKPTFLLSKSGDGINTKWSTNFVS